MVARGDLGVEVPLETVPAVQQRIVLAARRRGVPVILATQVLESMRTEPRPTRAEVTDAAHAVEERVDAIMLAGRDRVGTLSASRPSTVLDAIIREAERMLTALVEGAVPRALHGACTRARSADAAVALADSAEVRRNRRDDPRRKETARLLAAMRPLRTDSRRHAQSQAAAAMALVWGVTPVLTDHRRPCCQSATRSSSAGWSRQAEMSSSWSPRIRRSGTKNINFVHIERI